MGLIENDGISEVSKIIFQFSPFKVGIWWLFQIHPISSIPWPLKSNFGYNAVVLMVNGQNCLVVKSSLWLVPWQFFGEWTGIHFSSFFYLIRSVNISIISDLYWFLKIFWWSSRLTLQASRLQLHFPSSDATEDAELLEEILHVDPAGLTVTRQTLFTTQKWGHLLGYWWRWLGV